MESLVSELSSRLGVSLPNNYPRLVVNNNAENIESLWLKLLLLIKEDKAVTAALGIKINDSFNNNLTASTILGPTRGQHLTSIDNFLSPKSQRDLSNIKILPLQETITKSFNDGEEEEEEKDINDNILKYGDIIILRSLNLGLCVNENNYKLECKSSGSLRGKLLQYQTPKESKLFSSDCFQICSTDENNNNNKKIYNNSPIILKSISTGQYLACINISSYGNIGYIYIYIYIYHYINLKS